MTVTRNHENIDTRSGNKPAGKKGNTKWLKSSTTGIPATSKIKELFWSAKRMNFSKLKNLRSKMLNFLLNNLRSKMLKFLLMNPQTVTMFMFGRTMKTNGM